MSEKELNINDLNEVLGGANNAQESEKRSVNFSRCELGLEGNYESVRELIRRGEYTVVEPGGPGKMERIKVRYCESYAPAPTQGVIKDVFCGGCRTCVHNKWK